MEIPTYPNYSELNGTYQTYIRKEKDGIWYKMLVKCQEDLPCFFSACYMFIIFGQVNLDVKDIEGTSIAIIDEDQRTESERLLPIF